MPACGAGLAAPPRRDRFEAARKAASRPGTGKQPSRQRAVVEPGPADDQRQRAARLNLANRRAASRA